MEGMVVDDEDYDAAAELILKTKHDYEAGSIPCETI
jgi:hypothetical protein